MKAVEALVVSAAKGTCCGALHAGIPGRELAPAKSREEIGAVETATFGIRKCGCLKPKMSQL